MPHSLAALALAAVALPSVSAYAEAPVEHYSVTIPYDHDAGRMADRIDTAARRTCDRRGILMMAERLDVIACQEEFKAAAYELLQRLSRETGRKGAYTSRQ